MEIAQQKRPKAVPKGAIYYPIWKEWGVGMLKDGKKDGTWRFWWDNGTFVEESMWQDDQIHDENKRRYHDDGSLASIAHYDHGVMLRLRLYRSKSNEPTREPNLVGMHTNVREIEFRYRKDRWQYFQILRDEKGRELGFDGKPAPKRPLSLPQDAYYLSADRLWTMGEWYSLSEKPGDTLRRGLFKYFDVKGSLVRIEYYDSQGECNDFLDARPKVRPEGNPLIAAAIAKDEQAVMELLGVGAGALPNTAMHAAYYGLCDLARQIEEIPGTISFPDVRIKPSHRHAEVSADAVWVPTLELWVRGAYDPKTGRASGTWDMWWIIDDDCVFEQAIFEGGKRTELREDFEETKPHEWTFFDLDGKVILTRKNENSLVSEEETYPDGTHIEREFFPNGKLSIESKIKESRAEIRAYYDSGALQAEGASEADEEYGSKKMKGKWRFLYPDGKLVIEADMGGEWSFLANFDPKGVTSFIRMSKLRTWASDEASKVNWIELNDPDDCNWYAFNEIGGLVPWLLEGMMSTEPDLQNSAYGWLFNDTWHQGSIYESSANLTPFFLRMLGERQTNKEHLFDLLMHYASSLRESLPYMKKGARDATTRWLRRMHKSFINEHGEVLELARSPDSELRLGALALLSTNVFGDDLWPQVWNIFLDESNPISRAQIALALAVHAKQATALHDLERALEIADHDGVRFSLAMSIALSARRLEKPVPPAAISTLVALAKQPTPVLEETYMSLEGEDTTGPVEAQIALKLVYSLKSLQERLAVAQELVPALVHRMIAEQTIDAFDLAAALLALTQPRDKQEAKSRELRALRKSTLEGIALLPDKWWTWVNFLEVLDSFGVPRSHDPAEGRKAVLAFASKRNPWELIEDEYEDEGD